MAFPATNSSAPARTTSATVSNPMPPSTSILKFSPTLKLEDYFTPYNYAYLNCNDVDLASGGILMIPGTSNIVGGGKGGKLYMVNTATLGKEQANSLTNLVVETCKVLNGLIRSLRIE